MAFYRNKIERKSLVDKLVQLLTTPPPGSTEAYWKQVQSGSFQAEGYILHSKGKTGTDDIYVRFHNESFQNAIRMSIIEKYTPNPVSGLAGTIENESIQERIFYYNYEVDSNSNQDNSSYSYNENFPVHYVLSFDRDKIMLVLKGDREAGSYATQTLVWAGMPKRLSVEKDSTAAVFAVSSWANDLTNLTSSSWGYCVSKCRGLRNRRKAASPLYNMRSLKKFNTKGWGGHLLLSNLYLEDEGNIEGVRAIMDGVHPIHQDNSRPDFIDGDEITVGSKRFIVLKVHEFYSNSDYNTNCFPSQWMAVEQLL